MCGIFGKIGEDDCIHEVLEGLQRIEYRGYDSTGIAVVQECGVLCCVRSVGKVSELEKKVGTLRGTTALAHTRWATHGKVTLSNTHPIVDQSESIAVVHNGIIENFAALRSALEADGIIFRTETDTEVIPNLIAKVYKGNLLKAVQEVLGLLKGAWALAILHKNHPGECIVAASGCPLVIGVAPKATYLASDPLALSVVTKNVHFLHDGEVAKMTLGGVQFFDAHGYPVSKEIHVLQHHFEHVSKGTYEHYTLKEIFEQPQVIRNALFERYSEETGEVILEGIRPLDLVGVKRIVLVACGTSYHAALVGSYLFEELAGIPASAEIASEYRYKNPIVEEGTFAIAISQSGETADTLAAVQEAQSKGARILGICNVAGSTLTRKADTTLLLKAGPEIGVCSTKAFTSQLTVLTLLALLLARIHHMKKQQVQDVLNALVKIPEQIEKVLLQAPKIERIAEKYTHAFDFFFLGRRYMYPTSLEGALKLKEIAYVNANGYPGGEIKHGSIALLSEKCPVVALCCDGCTYEKMVSNITEAKARMSPVVGVIDHDDGHLKGLVDDIIMIPKTRDEVAPILTAVVCQLFAYYSARIRGTDIDMPKNLAKSVTVE